MCVHQPKRRQRPVRHIRHQGNSHETGTSWPVVRPSLGLFRSTPGKSCQDQTEAAGGHSCRPVELSPPGTPCAPQASVWRRAAGTSHLTEWATTIGGPADSPTVAELFPEIVNPLLDAQDNLPACSALEALERQEPFVNQTLGYHALAMLGRLFRHGHIGYHGGFISLATGELAALPVCRDKVRTRLSVCCRITPQPQSL